MPDFLLLLLYLGCSIPFGYLLNLLVQGHQDPLVFSVVFMADDVNGVGDGGSGDTTVDVQTLLEDSSNISLRSVCLNDAYSGKSKDFLIIRLHIKGILLYMVSHPT